MKISHFFVVAGLNLALCTLVLTGCAQELKAPTLDSRLVSHWTNRGNKDSYLEKTFRIEKDGTFTAELNPLALAAAASGQNESAVKVIVESITLAAGQSSTWQVTGKLVHVEGSIYTMNGLRARPGDVQVTPVTNGPPIVVEANTVLPGFSNQNVIINLAGDGVSFEFSHAGTDLIATQIKLFFGGTYHKVNP